MFAFTQLIKQNPSVLLFGFMMMFMTSPGQTYFIALFGAEIRSDLDLTHGQFGAIYSLATLASAFVLLKTGALIDRFDLRPLSITLVLGLAAAGLLMANSNSIITLAIAIFFLRHCGQGLMSMTASTSVMRYAAGAKGKANSLSNTGYTIAEATMPSIIIVLMAAIGWRTSWVVIAVLMAVCAPVLILVLLRNHHQRHIAYLHSLDTPEPTSHATPQSSLRQWTRAEVLRDPYFYLLTPALLMQSLLYTGFMFHQVHMVEVKGWPLLMWGSLYTLFALTSICTSLAVGAWADRVGAIKLAPYVTLPMMVGLLLLANSNSVLAAGMFMFCMGLSTGAQGALSAPFYAERYGTKNFASIKSLASFVMVIMTAMSPVILGSFIDSGVSIEQLAAASAALAASVILIASLASRRLQLEFQTQPQ